MPGLASRSQGGTRLVTRVWPVAGSFHMKTSAAACPLAINASSAAPLATQMSRPCFT
jgi:hypothetical protein